MKKIVALILSLVFVLSLASCGDDPCTEHVDADSNGICDVCEATVEPTAQAFNTDAIAQMYADSLPTKVVTTTKQVIGDNELNSRSVLTTGKVNGKLTAVYEYVGEELNEVSDSDTVPPLIKEVRESKIYHDGKISENGGAWKKGFNFAPLKGDIAINLDEENLIDLAYDEATSTLTFKVSAENVALVFGEEVEIESEISVSIVNDGAVITGISLTYTIEGTKEYPETVVTVDTVYTYDLEEITLA